jgi:hypothetical protein
MPAAEADIRTDHAASYLARLCGHASKMSQAGHRLSHRQRAHDRDGGPPEVRRVDRSGTEATVSLDRGQWTVRALPGRLTIRAEAADQEDLRRIQDLLTTRLERFGRREHLTVAWRAATAEARTTARSEDHEAERGGSSAPVPADRCLPGGGDEGSGK